MQTSSLAPRRRPRFRPWRRWLGGAPGPAERLSVTTADGIRLHVRRIRRPDTTGPAVLLLHGLASHGLTFHFPDRSLATYLATRGYDCFVPDLRGAGDSDMPRYGWDLDDYLLHDIPALLRLIREITNEAPLHAIGHSMGGILLMCHAMLEPRTPIQRGIAVASALDYSKGSSGFTRLLRLRRFAKALPLLPYGGLTHFTAPLFGRFNTALEQFHVWPSNIEPFMLRRMYASVFADIPPQLLLSLARTFDPSGFTTRDGSVRFLDEAAKLRLPMMFVSGSEDRQCPVEAVDAAHELVGSTDKTHYKVGKRHGHADDYGHFDLIVGKRAEQEVWPELGAWLDKGTKLSLA